MHNGHSAQLGLEHRAFWSWSKRFNHWPKPLSCVRFFILISIPTLPLCYNSQYVLIVGLLRRIGRRAQHGFVLGCKVYSSWEYSSSVSLPNTTLHPFKRRLDRVDLMEVQENCISNGKRSWTLCHNRTPEFIIGFIVGLKIVLWDYPTGQLWVFSLLAPYQFVWINMTEFYKVLVGINVWHLLKGMSDWGGGSLLFIFTRQLRQIMQ